MEIVLHVDALRANARFEDLRMVRGKRNLGASCVALAVGVYRLEKILKKFSSEVVAHLMMLSSQLLVTSPMALFVSSQIMASWSVIDFRRKY